MRRRRRIGAGTDGRPGPGRDGEGHDQSGREDRQPCRCVHVCRLPVGGELLDDGVAGSRDGAAHGVVGDVVALDGKAPGHVIG